MSLKAKDRTNKKIIAIFCPYPYAGAPSQRFRYEQYLEVLEQHGFHISYYPFVDTKTNTILYKKGHTFQKIAGVVKGYLCRIVHVVQSRKASYVLIHREAAPLGPPVFEWLLAKVLRKKVIYDFDDAIWLPAISEANRMVARLKWHHKVDSICRWSYKVSCGNPYLCHYAAQFNTSVVLNPTTIDTGHLHNRLKDQETAVPVIGWTGSHSTMRFLDDLVPVLRRLAEQYVFKVLIISNQPPDFALDNLEFIRWHPATEISDLLQLNAGIMPLTDDPWAKGKCGFKALQYLALGIPAVVSPVGVNTDILQPGINGYLCRHEKEWHQALATLITDTSLRIAMGQAGRQQVEAHFSVRSNTANFLQLFS